jgi:hypothetical protein
VATHRIPILGSANPSGGTAGAVFCEPYAIKATNDVWNPLLWVFNDPSARNGLACKFTVPKNYVGTAAFIVVWTSTATSGNVVWDVDYRAVTGNDTESLDQTLNQESVTVTDAADTMAAAALLVDFLFEYTDV